MKRPALACCTVLLGLAADPAAAQDPIDPTVGRDLSRAWCSSCHGILPGELHSPVPRAPSFSVLTRKTPMTDAALRVFLATPHATMPNIRLTPRELDAVIAYMSSLRPR